MYNAFNFNMPNNRFAQMELIFIVLSEGDTKTRDSDDKKKPTSAGNVG